MSTLYNIPNPSHRARFFDRAAEAVRKKACNLYHLDANSLLIPNGGQRIVTHECNEWLRGDYWHNRCNTEMAASGLEDADTPRIEATARIILQHYLEGFYLRRRLSCQLSHNPAYPEPHTRLSMADLFLSHRTNQGEALLEQCGLTPRAAHALNGTLIGIGVQSYQMYDDDERMSYVLPNQGSARGRTSQQIAARVNELRSFAKCVPQSIMEGNYRTMCAKRNTEEVAERS